MNEVQNCLKKWIDQNFSGVRVDYPSIDTARITDRNGEQMTISMNLYCDILLLPDHRIIAESNLPHDLLTIGYRMADEWTNYEWPGIEPKGTATPIRAPRGPKM